MNDPIQPAVERGPDHEAARRAMEILIEHALAYIRKKKLAETGKEATGVERD